MKANELPLVSIILPTYNRRYIIKRAIDSCFKQSYPSIEIIVCDDHSTDGTEEYIYEMKKNDNRIIYCRTPNGHKGANAARNVGIQIARGKYLCFLDSDDELLENSIQDRVKIFETHPGVGMVYGNVYAEYRRRRVPLIYNVLPQTKREARKYLLEELSLCSQISIMVRTKVFEKIGMLNERQRAWTDDGLVVAVGLRYPLIHCGTFVAMMHKSEVSMTSNKANLYQGLNVLVEKYKREIMREVSLGRYLLWRIRIFSIYCQSKEASSKFKVTKFVWNEIYCGLNKLLRPHFRNMYV